MRPPSWRSRTTSTPGATREAIGRLRALVDEHPLRERLRALLMLALYRAGRQAEALDVFRDARFTLVETLGLDPGPELRRLQEAILRQDPALDRVVPDEAWASRETAQRLDAGAGLASRRRTELRELEQELAADVVDLHTLRGRGAAARDQRTRRARSRAWSRSTSGTRSSSSAASGSSPSSWRGCRARACWA